MVVFSSESFTNTAAFIQLLSKMRPVLETKWASNYISTLKLPEVIHDRVADITDKELKTLTKTAFALLIADASSLLTFYMPAKAIAGQIPFRHAL